MLRKPAAAQPVAVAERQARLLPAAPATHTAPSAPAPIASYPQQPTAAGRRKRPIRLPPLGPRTACVRLKIRALNPEDYEPAANPIAGALDRRRAAHTRHRRKAPDLRAGRRGCRHGLPELRLDMHVYSAKPQDRFVLLNMQRLHEGDSLPEACAWSRSRRKAWSCPIAARNSCSSASELTPAIYQCFSTCSSDETVVGQALARKVVHRALPFVLESGISPLTMRSVDSSISRVAGAVATGADQRLSRFLGRHAAEIRAHVALVVVLAVGSRLSAFSALVSSSVMAGGTPDSAGAGSSCRRRLRAGRRRRGGRRSRETLRRPFPDPRSALRSVRARSAFQSLP